MAKNLLKRFGKPDAVAGTVLYLASPIGNVVTNHVLLVDTGWTAHKCDGLRPKYVIQKSD